MFYWHSIAPLLEACKPPRCGVGRSLRYTPAPGARGARLLVLVQAAARCPRSRLPRWSEEFVRAVDLLAGQRMVPGWWEPDTGSHPIPLAAWYQRQNVSRQHTFDPICS